MSIYSDYKVGAMSEVEFHNACVTENLKDRAYLEDLADKDYMESLGNEDKESKT